MPASRAVTRTAGLCAAAITLVAAATMLFGAAMGASASADSRADVRITLDVLPAAATVGSSLEYVAVLRNVGTAPVQAVAALARPQGIDESTWVIACDVIAEGSPGATSPPLVSACPGMLDPHAEPLVSLGIGGTVQVRASGAVRSDAVASDLEATAWATPLGLRCPGAGLSNICRGGPSNTVRPQLDAPPVTAPPDTTAPPVTAPLDTAPPPTTTPPPQATLPYFETSVTTDSPSYLMGQPVIYLVRVANTGGADGTAMVSAAAPGAGPLSWSCAADPGAPGGACDGVAGPDEAVVALPGGSAVLLTLTGVAIGPSLQPSVTVAATTPGCSDADCGAGLALPVGPAPDGPAVRPAPVFGLPEVTADRDAYVLGEPITVHVTLANTGSGAGSAALQLDVPPAVAIDSVACTDGDGAPCPVSWTDGAPVQQAVTLAANSQVEITVRGTFIGVGSITLIASADPLDAGCGGQCGGGFASSPALVASPAAGTIVASVDAANPCFEGADRPMPDVSVFLLPAQGGALIAEARTNAAGQAVLGDDLPPGDYLVSIADDQAALNGGRAMSGATTSVHLGDSGATATTIRYLLGECPASAPELAATGAGVRGALAGGLALLWAGLIASVAARRTRAG